MGPSLQLTIYKNDDDSVTKLKDRQRIEMKVPDNSPTSYLATRDTNYVYTWWFKLDQDMVVGDSFFHIFQLKAVVNVPDMPVFTLSLSNQHGLHMRSNIRGIEILDPKTDYFNLVPRLESVKGKWIYAKANVNYSNIPSNGS